MIEENKEIQLEKLKHIFGKNFLNMMQRNQVYDILEEIEELAYQKGFKEGYDQGYVAGNKDATH